jgi:hypothetical protein
MLNTARRMDGMGGVLDCRLDVREDGFEFVAPCWLHVDKRECSEESGYEIWGCSGRLSRCGWLTDLWCVWNFTPDSGTHPPIVTFHVSRDSSSHRICLNSQQPRLAASEALDFDYLCSAQACLSIKG